MANILRRRPKTVTAPRSIRHSEKPIRLTYYGGDTRDISIDDAWVMSDMSMNDGEPDPRMRGIALGVQHQLDKKR